MTKPVRLCAYALYLVRRRRSIGIRYYFAPPFGEVPAVGLVSIVHLKSAHVPLNRTTVN